VGEVVQEHDDKDDQELFCGCCYCRSRMERTQDAFLPLPELRKRQLPERKERPNRWQAEWTLLVVRVMQEAAPWIDYWLS
jgi:hypothetical protein